MVIIDIWLYFTASYNNWNTLMIPYIIEFSRILRYFSAIYSILGCVTLLFTAWTSGIACQECCTYQTGRCSLTRRRLSSWRGRWWRPRHSSVRTEGPGWCRRWQRSYRKPCSRRCPGRAPCRRQSPGSAARLPTDYWNNPIAPPHSEVGRGLWEGRGWWWLHERFVQWLYQPKM